MWNRRNMSSRFFKNSEAFSSEFVENLELFQDSFTVMSEAPSKFQPHNSMLPVVKKIRDGEVEKMRINVQEYMPTSITYGGTYMVLSTCL